MSMILNKEQVKCLSSEARNEVLSAIRLLGQATVKEIAAKIGRSIETTHYHVREMARLGLLVVVGQRPTGKRLKSVYAAASPRFVFPLASQDRDAAEFVPK